MIRGKLKTWPPKAVDPPKLTDQQWNLMGLLGSVFFVMAILQLISFTYFTDWLKQIGLGAPSVWAAALIMAELWASASFFKLRLSPGFRIVSLSLAVLVSGFWFIQNLRLVSNGASGYLTGSGFFGRFLQQPPGWLTVFETSLLLFFTIFAVNLSKEKM